MRRKDMVQVPVLLQPRLLLCMILLGTTVADARFYHAPTKSTRNRYMPLAGIFGFNNGDRKDKSQQQQQKQQQQNQKLEQQQRHSSNSFPPPPERSRRQTGPDPNGRTFVRSPHDQNQNKNDIPQTLVPPQFRSSTYINSSSSYNQQQQQQPPQQVFRQREIPPPPPPPPLQPPPPPQPLNHDSKEKTNEYTRSDKTLSSSGESNNAIEVVDVAEIFNNNTNNYTCTNTGMLDEKDAPVPVQVSSIYEQNVNNNNNNNNNSNNNMNNPNIANHGQHQQPTSVQQQDDPSQFVNNNYYHEPQDFSSNNESPKAIWSQQQQQHQQYNNEQHQQHSSQSQPSPYVDYDTSLFYVQEELSESLARESSLVLQLENITSTILILQQREELHMRQLDVLTERVMDVESQSAEERNLLLEYEANCTKLETVLVDLRKDVEDWKSRCEEFDEKHNDDQVKLSELRQTIKEKVLVAEELAIAMEQLRLTEGNQKELASSGHRGHSHSKGGRSLFSWIFGFLGFSSNVSSKYDEGLREEAFDMAKSTLLRALQFERSSVDELETAVASLQQNNKGKTEMVQSRDIIIDELNNRIAVFEEDKVVLKAALRQLQKEMKEEEPKTQKLIEEKEQLESDFHSIIGTHHDELAAIQKAMSQKQKTIKDAEFNLTTIGTYVDKLEERLTSFAMTRRDMEKREKVCKEIEKNADDNKTQRKMMETKIEEFKTQEDDLKKLLEELVKERADLQTENRKLYTEQEFRIGKQEQLEENCKTLQTEVTAISEEVVGWRDKYNSLVEELESSRNRQLDLENKVGVLKGREEKMYAVQVENQDVIERNKILQKEIVDVLEERDQIQASLKNMTKEAEERTNQSLIGKGATIMDKSVIELEKNKGLEASSDANQLYPPPPPPPPQPRPSHILSSGVPKKNDVFLRSLRKTLSKATGFHGLLTPSSNTVIQSLDETEINKRI